jgi:hypothetical protein
MALIRGTIVTGHSSNSLSNRREKAIAKKAPGT